MKRYIPQADGTMKEVDVPGKLVVTVNETIPISSGQIVVPGKSKPIAQKPIEPKPIVTPPPTKPVEPKPIEMSSVKPKRASKKEPAKEVKKVKKGR